MRQVLTTAEDGAKGCPRAGVGLRGCSLARGATKLPLDMLLLRDGVYVRAAVQAHGPQRAAAHGSQVGDSTLPQKQR